MTDSTLLLRGTQTINDRGHLVIGGCDAADLAAQWGTPLYVLDESYFRARCREYKTYFQDRRAQVEIAFAGKALMNIALCRIIQQEGLSLEVCSAGELYTAQMAQFPPDRILFHGNFKSDEELQMAVAGQAGRVVVDSFSELHRLSKLAAASPQPVDILIRIAPGIKTHTHTYIQTGQVDSKFGLGIASGAAMQAVKLSLELPGLNLTGLHCHIGSQLFALDCFAKAVDLMIQFLAQVREEGGVTLGQLNLGGGLGIAYTSEDAPPSIEELAEVICPACQQAADRYGYPLPKLIIEPGRSIVGPAGTTLYTVGPIKNIPGVRTYVAVDGGLSDNPRPMLYDAEYSAVVANKADQGASVPVRIAGKHCETDTLIPEVALASVAEGDILAVFSTGAYHYSMASNYNRFSRPAMVLVNDGQADLIAQRETLEDLVKHDVIPSRLQ